MRILYDEWKGITLKLFYFNLRLVTANIKIKEKAAKRNYIRHQN